VPHHVGFGAVSPFLHEGALTRTVDDAALALDVLAGYDDRDPFAIDQPVSFVEATRTSIRGRRIAFSPDFGVYPVDRRVAALVEEAVRTFEEAGAIVEPVEFAFRYDHRELTDLWCRMFGPINVDGLEGLDGVAPLRDNRDDFPPEFLSSVDDGRRLTALDMLRDQHMRTHVYEEVQRVMRSYDLLVTPTLAGLPVENTSDGNTVGPREIDGVAVDPLIGWCLTYLINFTGHPAASIPAGLADGLPVGLQIIGRRYGDADVLAASAEYERLRPWQQHYRLAAQRPLG
jgi:amidase